MKKLIQTLIFLLLSTNVIAALPNSVLSESDHITGKKISDLMTNEKKATVIFFMSTKCPCSISHTPHFTSLARRYKDIQFIGVHSNADENATDLSNFLKGKRLPFPVIRDDNATIAKEFGAIKTPHTFVLNSKGERLFHGGATNRSNATYASKFYLKDALAKIRKGELPEMKFARALGCYLKR